MSSIYFADVSGDARISGSEVTNLQLTMSDLLIQGLGFSRYFYDSDVNAAKYMFGEERSYLFVDDDYAKLSDRVRSCIYARFADDKEKLHHPCGGPLQLLSVGLNTAVAVGSDPIRFAARIYGQSELNAFILGEDRSFIASVIQDGLASGIFRQNEGWESVAAFLLSSKKRDVVLVDSNSFPSALYCNGSAKNYEKWSEEKRWKKSFKGLYQRFKWLGIDESTLRYTFSHGVNAYQLRAAVDAHLKCLA